MSDRTPLFDEWFNSVAEGKSATHCSAWTLTIDGVSVPVSSLAEQQAVVAAFISHRASERSITPSNLRVVGHPPSVEQSDWAATTNLPPPPPLKAPTAASSTPGIERPPGWALRNALRHICSRDLYAIVVEQHADAEEWYFEALKKGDLNHARSIKVMMNVWMLRSVVGGAVSWAFGLVTKRLGSSGN